MYVGFCAVAENQFIIRLGITFIFFYMLGSFNEYKW